MTLTVALWAVVSFPLLIIGFFRSGLTASSSPDMIVWMGGSPILQMIGTGFAAIGVGLGVGIGITSLNTTVRRVLNKRRSDARRLSLGMRPLRRDVEVTLWRIIVGAAIVALFVAVFVGAGGACAYYAEGSERITLDKATRVITVAEDKLWWSSQRGISFDRIGSITFEVGVEGENLPAPVSLRINTRPTRETTGARFDLPGDYELAATLAEVTGKHIRCSRPARTILRLESLLEDEEYECPWLSRTPERSPPTGTPVMP